MHLMIDIETNGTLAEKSSIIQIAAQCFDETGWTVNKLPHFDKCLVPLVGRNGSQETFDWWQETKLKSCQLQSIHNRMQSARRAFKAFIHWVEEIQAEGELDTWIWAKHPEFDLGFCRSYCDLFDLQIPLVCISYTGCWFRDSSLKGVEFQVG